MTLSIKSILGMTLSLALVGACAPKSNSRAAPAKGGPTVTPPVNLSGPEVDLGPQATVDEAGIQLINNLSFVSVLSQPKDGGKVVSVVVKMKDKGQVSLESTIQKGSNTGTLIPTAGADDKVS